MSNVPDLKKLEQALSLLATVFSKDEDASRMAIRDTGIDVSTSIQANLDFLQRTQGKARRRLAAAKRERLTALREKAAAKVQQILITGEEAIRRLTASNEALAVQFRNLQSIDEESALDLMDEVELLDLIEKLDDALGEESE